MLKIIVAILIILATLNVALADEDRFNISDKTNVIINITNKDIALNGLSFSDYSHKDYVSKGFEKELATAVTTTIKLNVTVWVTNWDGFDGDKLKNTDYKHLPFFRCIIYNSTNSSIDHYLFTNFQQVDSQRRKIIIEGTFNLKGAKRIVCEDPLINSTKPVIGYVVLDNVNQINPDTVGWLANNKIQNYSYIAILSSWTNLTAYNNYVDLYFIAGMQSINAGIVALNQSPKGIVTANREAPIYLGICNQSYTWSGSAAIANNISRIVINATNNWVLGSNTIYDFKDGAGCNVTTLNLNRQWYVVNNSANNRYSMIFIPNNTAFFKWTNKARWASLTQSDWMNTSSSWTELARNTTLLSMNWVIEPDRTAAANVSSTCSCPSSAQNWLINMNEGCNVTSNCNIGAYNLTLNGSGRLQIKAILSIRNILGGSSGQIITGNSSGFINRTS